MKLAEFDYKLPKELIAQYPTEERDKCRLMVLDRKSGKTAHGIFSDITGYLREGDCLILNNTKVIPARLFGKRKTGGKVEIFLLEKKEPACEALIRQSGRLKKGEKVRLECGAEAEMLERGEIGRFVRFDRPLEDIVKTGHTPLPPYISRADEETDKHDYQTVYGGREGATASPTAGLHFTRELLGKISVSGVRVAYLTLHTSYGTFAPVNVEDVEDHRMHREYFELPEETANIVKDTRDSGGRVFAVGTTTTRVLEHCANEASGPQFPVVSKNGYTDLFIYPGYGFKAVDAMITNFHLPKSTLMLLVCAFAGRDPVMSAYREAIARRYRFFSYGDAMLII